MGPDDTMLRSFFTQSADLLIKLKGFSSFSRSRYLIIAALLFIIVISVIGRVLYLTCIKHDFLMSHALSNSVHKHILFANRGTIYDRNGVALAVSTPVDNIVLDPKVFAQDPSKFNLLTQVTCLNLSEANLKNILKTNSNSVFYYIAKQVPPDCADQVTDLRIPGVYAELQQKTFYPLGPALAQIVGFTNNTNQGADGMELALNSRLQGSSGLAWVEEDALGHILKIKQIITPPVRGQDVYLSIDSRLQTIAYEALKNQVPTIGAETGSLVALDTQTGEILAAVSYPSFNPNDPNDRVGEKVKDLVFTDAFEPGSTMKVVTLAAALESGQFTPDTPIDTSPGRILVGGHQIHDDADFGQLTVTSVLTKSSNIGASKIALSIPHQLLFDQIEKAGFGLPATDLFPGTSSGILHSVEHMGDFEYATMSFGYAISTSLLQMAKVYAAIANHGILQTPSLLKLDAVPAGHELMPATVAAELMAMLHTVVGPQGTGLLANIPGYQIAGKTGTAHLVGPDGLYEKKHYNAMFIGIAPYEHPRIAIAIRMQNPTGYFNSFGGVASAPVFAKVASAAMIFMDIPPTESQVDVNFFKKEHQFLQQIINA